jgi:hypothetical protein
VFSGRGCVAFGLLFVLGCGISDSPLMIRGTLAVQEDQPAEGKTCVLTVFQSRGHDFVGSHEFHQDGEFVFRTLVSPGIRSYEVQGECEAIEGRFVLEVRKPWVTESPIDIGTIDRSVFHVGGPELTPSIAIREEPTSVPGQTESTK